MADSSFLVLSRIDCSAHIEQKNGLSYLSWAWAWAELKKLYPRSYYTIYEDANGMFYHTDGKTCWVKTGVTLYDHNTGTVLEHIEFLPVMDNRNKSIPKENVTSFDVNKAIQRSLTKAVARHGLGLYIYAGEDLPEVADIICEVCQKAIPPETLINGKRYPAEKVAAASEKQYGKKMCYSCKLKADLEANRVAENPSQTEQESAS